VLFWLAGCERGIHRDDVPIVIIPRAPEQLDPRHVGDPYGLKLSRLLHASLLTIDPRTLDVIPDLAESWSIESPTTYRVRLRANLRFADGSPLDADDVVATFRALVDPRVKSRFVSVYSRIARVESASAREVVFTLREPHATFATDLEIPILRSEDAFSPVGSALVASGPYLLAQQSSGEVVLHANRHHHRPPGRHPQLRFLVIRDDNTRVLRMLGGAGDLSLNTIPALLLPLLSARENFVVRTAPGVGTTYIGINLTHPQLSEQRVRHALALAIDRETLIRHKFDGRARLATSWIPLAHWAFDPACPQVPYDPAEAERLLDAAGLPRARDGMRASFTLRTGSDRSVVSLARAIAAFWRRIGMDVEVRPSESATLLADLGRGRFELTLLQVPEVFEPHLLSWFFASERIPEAGVNEGGNRWRLRDPELDALLEQGRSTVERSARVPIYHAVQRRLAHVTPIIPLWHEDVVAVTSPRLRDFVVGRDGRYGTLAH
jgi:peptide/nickel transport system substrate-binding protein